MKWIHTSDWHLGKLLKEQSMTEDQEWILKREFLPLIDEEKPDVIFLAGDVYDRSLPPEEAVELFDEITQEIVGVRKIPMIIISGNHDSPERLAVGSRLLNREGLYIFGPLTRAHPVTLSDQYGDVAIYPMPYAEPARVRVMMNALSIPGAEDIHSFQQAAAEEASHVLSMDENHNRRVAIAHLFAAGGEGSSSERPLSIGGSDKVDISVFNPFQYAALGHLHRPQTMNDAGTIRYAGSLLPYSFGEAKQKKGVVIGTMDGDGNVETSFQVLKPRREVRRVRGLFQDIMESDDDHTDDYVEVVLDDHMPVIDAMPKIREKYPNALGVVQELGRKEDTGSKIQLETMTDMEIFEQFASEFRGFPLTDEEKKTAESCWDAVHKKENEE
jgi:exonuclease SbcD